MILRPDAIQLDLSAADAEEAIASSGRLLLSQGLAEESYVEAMVQAFRDLGPYMVLAPGIALPHARPESGALEGGIAFARLADPVQFGHPTNDPVTLLIPIVGTDPQAHIAVLRQLSSVLSDPLAVDVLRNSDDPTEIANIFEATGKANQ